MYAQWHCDRGGERSPGRRSWRPPQKSCELAIWRTECPSSRKARQCRSRRRAPSLRYEATRTTAKHTRIGPKGRRKRNASFCEFEKEEGQRSTSGNALTLVRRLLLLLLLRSPPLEISSTAALGPAFISLHHLAALLRCAQVGERGRGATRSGSRHDLGSSGGGARSRAGGGGGGGGRVGGEFGERSRAQRDAGEEGEEHRRVALKRMHHKISSQ